MAEMVEHQATVETGLKMKIKRKNPTQKTSAELRCKAAAAGSEDKNGNIKSRKTKPDNREVAGDFAPTIQTTEEKVSEETLKEPEERPQKRKRNAKSIRQTTIQNGVDYEVTKGNKSKPDSDSHSKAQVTSAKDKPKNGKICPPEKASRKRAASVCAVVPVVSSCETPKAKSLRITTYDKDTVIEEKNTDCRKPGYSGMKTDTEDSPRKAESKSSQQPQPHGEIPSQAALSLRGGGDDPYEFVAKVEDVIQTPIKKFKSDKADLTSFPAEPFLSAAAAAVAGVGTVGGGGHHDIATETCSVGVTTDPDCLGPCEPGTSVILEGIVWSESNNGILVVNVTWRGKTYVGTLMDTTKHHWASPRFRDDSPIPEVDWRSPKSKRTSGTTPVVEVLEGRRLRNSRQRNIPASSSCTSSSSLKGTSNTLRVQSPVQLEANNGRRRAQRMADNADMTTSSSNCIMTQPLKKTRPAMTNENDGEDPLLECTLLNCNKKFKHISGLNYHQSHAHRKTLVDESKPGGGKVPSAAMDGNLEATLSTETGETEVTHEENANCGVESTEVLSADVVVPVTDEVDLAGSRAQSDCSMNKSVCSVVNLPVSLSIASSCTSGAPVVDASGPGFDGKHPQKIKNNHASSPPPRPSKPVEEEPSSESEQSSGLSRSPPLRQVPPPPPQDFKPNDGGKSLRASDAEKNRLAETKINGSPTPLVLSSKSPSNPSHHPLPVGSDDKEGRSCVIPSTGDHQSQSETPTTGPGLSASAVTNVSSSPLASSFSSSSGFLIGADNKSPNYSDISDSAEFISGQMDYSRANGHQPQQQGKDGATRKQQRPMFDSRQQKSKQETTGAAQSHSSSTSGISALPHLSVPQSNGNHAGYDAVRQQKMKDPSAAKETIDSSSAAANSSYTKPATPEEKPAISQIAYHADAADAQAKEHRLWLENLHHQHHQNSAIASSMAMASSAAAAMNMMPYGYGLDQAAYHLQFLSQNPETRSHYERWLMEQSHYLQQQQQHHHQQQQQQRCFSKLMQVETERGPPSSDSKPVDMTSKGSIHPSNDSTASGLAPPFGGKPKGGRLGDGRPADSANKPLHKSTIALEANNDWMSVRHSHSIPSVNGIADSCGDSRRTTTAQPSGRNNASKEKLDGVKPPDQFHKGGKDALWERNERVVMNKEMGSPDDLTGGSSHLTPISKASNSVGNISPYSSGGLLKNLVFQDSSHQQSPPIGYSPSASFMEMSSSEAATSISPNSKFLDLDSKQVVTGSNLRRSGDGRHALDVLRYQSAMYGKQSSTAAEHLGSNGPKHNRSTLSKDFLEEPGHSKDGKGSPSGHSSPLTLRHLHTHHHTHVVGAAYPIYGSYNGLMSPVPAIVPSGPPVIAPTYLPK